MLLQNRQVPIRQAQNSVADTLQKSQRWGAQRLIAWRRRTTSSDGPKNASAEQLCLAGRISYKVMLFADRSFDSTEEGWLTKAIESLALFHSSFKITCGLVGGSSMPIEMSPSVTTASGHELHARAIASTDFVTIYATRTRRPLGG